MEFSDLEAIRASRRTQEPNHLDQLAQQAAQEPAQINQKFPNAAKLVDMIGRALHLPVQQPR